VPAVQTPAWQVSAPLHAFPSEHAEPFGAFGWAQPVVGLHESAVQGFESRQLSGVPAVQTPPWQTSPPSHTLASAQEVPLLTEAALHPVAGLQESVVHGFPSLQTSGAESVHVPFWQVSVPSQRLASAHWVPLGTFGLAHPVVGLQLSAVQAFPSVQLSGVPGLQVPAWQVSAPLHAFPSEQAWPFATAVFWHPERALQESVVQGFESLQLSAVPAAHVPD
jgi:hypothetical protein